MRQKQLRKDVLFMKRPLAMLLCLVLTLSLYAACSMNSKTPADDAPSVTFTRDNMPRLDG